MPTKRQGGQDPCVPLGRGVGAVRLPTSVTGYVERGDEASGSLAGTLLQVVSVSCHGNCTWEQTSGRAVGYPESPNLRATAQISDLGSGGQRKDT